MDAGEVRQRHRPARAPGAGRRPVPVSWPTPCPRRSGRASSRVRQILPGPSGSPLRAREASSPAAGPPGPLGPWHPRRQGPDRSPRTQENDMQTQIQLIANLTHDPELRYSTSGKAYVRLRLASTPRVKDAAGAWVDGATTFYEGRAWKDLAEHAAESLRRGDRVIAFGALRTERWKDSTGDDREALRVDVDEVGPSLRFANAKVVKAHRDRSELDPTPSPTTDPAGDQADQASHAATGAVVRHLGGRPVDAPF